MGVVTIYHNPRCSKSRITLALLKENSVNPEVVLYLDTPPDTRELKALLKKLRLTDAYKASGLNKDSDDEEILAAMAKYPKLIERPIVVKGRRAVLGRPPENVLELIK
jgi:arsenate reductase